MRRPDKAGSEGCTGPKRLDDTDVEAKQGPMPRKGGHPESNTHLESVFDTSPVKATLVGLG